MADTLSMTTPGAAQPYKMDPAIAAILGIQGSDPYGQELNDQTVAGIRRRAAVNKSANVAATQSDFLARGGTGSSLEALTMNEARLGGDQAGEDQVLQYMLGAMDRTNQDRQFKIGLAFQDYQDRVAREHEERLANQYMERLAAEQAEERRRRKKSGKLGAITTLVGGGVGAFYGGPAGATAGAGVGGQLPFLFS